MLSNLRTFVACALLETEKDGVIASKVRADQIRTIIRITPLMMTANVVNATIVTGYLFPKTGAVFLLAWSAAIYVLAAIGFWHWYRQRNERPVLRASRRGLRHVARKTLVLAAIWALLPAVMYPAAEPATRLIIVGVSAGMVGGGCLALYVVPLAMYAWIAAFTVGAAIGLAQGGQEDIMLLMMLGMFGVSLSRSGYSMARTYIDSRLVSLKVKEQAATIGMLLNDFSQSARDWLWQTDTEGTLVRGDEHFQERVGFSLVSLRPDHDWRGQGTARPVVGQRMMERLWSNFCSQTEFKNIRFHVVSGGATRWISMSGKPILDDDGRFSGFRGVASDVTEEKESEERIAYLAYNDALTGLVNRANFHAELDRVFAATSQGPISVLYLDLDGFKPVNDTYGHTAGDSLLIEIGQRLRATVGDHDIVARLGGDEFAILSRAAVTTQSASALAEKLVAAVGRAAVIGDCVIQISVSIGIAFSGRDGSNPQQLLHNADLALYRAKAEGKSGYRFYEIEMDEVVRQRRVLENDLRIAVRSRALSLNFQPLVDAASERTTGFEALVRWYHPVHGSVPPADFIPVAERIGLISDIGQWVLTEACCEAANWPAHLSVAVNLSPQQFADHQIVDHVARALEASGLAPQRLELEITESLFMENTQEVMSTLNRLKGMGVSIALDDFGTGYSSLSYLLKFPFDKLKIDRAFITSIDDGGVARDVLETITRLGTILNLSVTAEGVETEAQANMLRAMSCTHFQGFHFGKPLERSDLPAFLLGEVVRAGEATEKRERRKRVSEAKAPTQKAARRKKSASIA
jgi:diguanylate cyclase (GGDEF)-like protein/PAS domain S-box-containing protein